MKTILVTGGAGFIGSNFIHYLLKNTEEYSIINLDKLTYAGNLANLGKSIEIDSRYKFIHGDICNQDVVDTIFNEYKPDFVVNFAAESHVDRSIIYPNLFVETNILGTSVLLNSAKKSWNSNIDGNRFLQVSTDEVYGTLPEDEPDTKFTEQTPIQPHSPYSASKASADLLVQSYFDTFGMPVVTTRCSNNYGPFQFPEKLIPLMINNAVSNKPLPVYGDGLNIRDWLFVDDHCSAILTVLEKGKLGEVYNIGGNNEIKNIDIVKSIIDYLGKPLDLIKYVKDRPGHDRRYAIDATKIKNELGWTPAFTFEQQIKYTIDWYLQNKKWIEDIVSGDYLNYYNLMYGNR